ncbi:hypothetical protein GE061_013256 [Apolygus lucorum]|uniref:Uncharacterized protein n=1 Tax=Apolygus lucorum TaxID=248454 RepID=A0A8S9XNH3_APOLU|nr:hypothetical protein GE061_013256 [Apolygus lucorum]
MQQSAMVRRESSVLGNGRARFLSTNADIATRRMVMREEDDVPRFHLPHGLSCLTTRVENQRKDLSGKGQVFYMGVTQEHHPLITLTIPFKSGSCIMSTSGGIMLLNRN